MKTNASIRFIKVKQSAKILLPTLFVIIVLILNSCQKEIKRNEMQSQQSLQTLSSADDDISAGSIQAGQMVLTWNNAANEAVNRMTAVTGKPVSPPPDSRILAMINVAMHDALNTIVPRYER